MAQSLEIEEITYAHKVIDLSNFFYVKLKTKDYSIAELDFYSSGYIALFRRLSTHDALDLDFNIRNNTNKRTKNISEMILETVNCSVKKATVSNVNANLLELIEKGLKTDITQINFLDAIKAVLLCEKIYPILCNKEWPFSIKNTIVKVSEDISNNIVLDTLSAILYNQDENTVRKLSSEILPDIEAEGIVQLTLSKMELGEFEMSKDEKAKLALRLYKYVKEVALKADLLNFFNKGFMPQSKAVRQIFFSSIILQLIGFDKSLSIPYPETIEYVDQIMETAIVKKTINKGIKEGLLFNTLIILPAIGDKYILKLSLPKIMTLFLTLFAASIILSISLFNLIFNNMYGMLFNMVLISTILVFYMFIINASTLFFGSRKLLKQLK